MTYNKLIPYLKKALYTIIMLLGGVFILTTLYYFNVINKTVFNIIKIIWLIFSIFINSYGLGKKAHNKGYLIGLYFALILLVILMVFRLIFHSPWNTRTLIYYMLIIFTAILAAMFGINKKVA